jgi:hypothetical protein
MEGASKGKKETSTAGLILALHSVSYQFDYRHVSAYVLSDKGLGLLAPIVPILSMRTPGQWCSFMAGCGARG